MQFERMAIADVVLIRPRVLQDARGHFFESWEERKFAAAGLDLRFRQDNQSLSGRHVLRGLHDQLRRPQGKLVSVVAGAAFDVVVDLRRSSPTFGKWVGAELTQDNHHLLWVPPGFAHGFAVRGDSACVLYKCTEFHDPQDERAILWNDPDLSIQWSLPAGTTPAVSERDRAAIRFRDAEYYA
jgi:dTDP-4-dehydrorhamnose 3,5-epimerase